MSGAGGGAGRSTYSRVSIWLHWTIGLAIIANIVLVLAHESVTATLGGTMMGWHKALGITVLALSLFRWAWRLGHRPPPLPTTVKRWEKGLAHALHWTFYLLIVLMPLTGWAMSSGATQRRPLTWFGLFDIPYLPVARGGSLAGVSHEFHEIAGYAMIALIVLHIAAAIKHQLVDRDNVVHRMLPLVSPSQR